MELPNKADRGIHTIQEHVIFEWLYDGKAFFLQLKSIDRIAIDTWYEVIETVATDWSEKDPFLTIYDLSGIGLTPYFRQRSSDVTDALAHLSGRYAVVIPPTDSMAQTMRLFFEYDARRPSKRVGKIHPDRQSAEMWIGEGL